MVNLDADNFSNIGDSDGPSGLGGLVPSGTDNCTTCAPFLHLIMASFGVLTTEAAVLKYTHGFPDFHKQIQQLVAEVSAAGVRARDSGQLKNDRDDSLRIYSPEEIWMFDLAVDLIAMLGCMQGLADSSLVLYKRNVRTLDSLVVTHAWKHALKKAGAGPAQFQELRSGAPHHKASLSR